MGYKKSIGVVKSMRGWLYDIIINNIIQENNQAQQRNIMGMVAGRQVSENDLDTNEGPCEALQIYDGEKNTHWILIPQDQQL